MSSGDEPKAKISKENDESNDTPIDYSSGHKMNEKISGADGNENNGSIDKNNDNDSHCHSTTVNSVNDLNSLNLSKFNLIKVLDESPHSKTIFIEANANDGKAVLLIEKTAFNEQNVKKILSETNKPLEKIFTNGIYGNYLAFPNAIDNSLKVTVIHPASEKHIAKYSKKKTFLIEETENDYKEITKPFIEQNQFSLDWVYNILSHEKEADRILFEDKNDENGFLLLPDLKWDGREVNNLYIMAIAFRKDIKCLRDLNRNHLSLLKNIKEKGCKAITEKFNIKSSQLKIYIHYLPSYYHFHVHFTALFDAPGSNLQKCHLLDTVIYNIEQYDDYYKKARLTVSLSEDDPLGIKFKEYKHL